MLICLRVNCALKPIFASIYTKNTLVRNAGYKLKNYQTADNFLAQLLSNLLIFNVFYFFRMGCLCVDNFI